MVGGRASAPSRVRQLRRAVCRGLPMKVRLCSNSKCLVRVGDIKLGVVKIGSGRSVLKVGVFRGPGVPVRVGEHLHTKRGVHFAIGCSFSLTGTRCPAILSKVDCFRVAMSIILSRGGRVSGFLFVTRSIARTIRARRVLQRDGRGATLTVRTTRIVL